MVSVMKGGNSGKRKTGIETFVIENCVPKMQYVCWFT